MTQDLRLDHLRGKVDQLTEVLAGYEARVDGCLPVQPSVIYYLMKTREPRDKQTTVMDSILENGLPDGNTSDLTARLERMVTIREVPQCEESKGPLQSGEKLIDKRQGESMIQIDNQDSSVNSVMAEEKREEEIKDEKEMNDDEKGKEEDITHSDKEGKMARNILTNIGKDEALNHSTHQHFDFLSKLCRLLAHIRYHTIQVYSSWVGNIGMHMVFSIILSPPPLPPWVHQEFDSH